MLRPFDRKRAPLLTSLLDEACFRLVDIGGRGSGFTPLIPLAPFAHYFVAEPDAQEARRLKDQLSHRASWRSVTVIAEALAVGTGEADLYVTRKPGMSSLLQPDRAVTRRFFLDSRFEVASTVKVPTLPLDEAAARYGFSDAAFLKLDTQGTELDILRSGPRLVDGSLLGVNVEASFRRFYKEQPLFADIDTYLRKQGYELFSLNRTLLRRTGYRASVYSKRVVTWAHCLYLREPETVLRVDGDARRSHLWRLLGLVLAFKFYDVALEIVELAARAAVLSAPDVARLREEAVAICNRGTVHALREHEQNGPDDPRASSFRDGRKIE